MLFYYREKSEAGKAAEPTGFGGPFSVPETVPQSASTQRAVGWGLGKVLARGTQGAG